jgi:hypothetical protein
VAIEFGKQIFDEDLAAQLLAKKADVAADDGPKIDEHGRFPRRESRQEFPEGRENGIVNSTDASPGGRTSRLPLARCETVQQTHHGKNLEVKERS